MAVALLIGCPGGTDTDADAEDTEPPLDEAEPVSGSITYVTSVDGETVCDAEISLSGTEYFRAGNTQRPWIDTDVEQTTAIQHLPVSEETRGFLRAN
jgi:hypothetical protein